MIAKHEHNLAQQEAMLDSVRTQLAEVRDTVGALRALVSETMEPPINSVVPLLPLPREPPPIDNGGILPTLPFLKLILILIWKKRLDLSSQSPTRRGCL